MDKAQLKEKEVKAKEYLVLEVAESKKGKKAKPTVWH